MFKNDKSDTIVALATPQGIGAIGVIRLSGNYALNIVNQVFVGKNLLKQASHTLHYGKIVYDGQTIDEVVVSVFLAPSSYTKENVVEISCHGSPYILQKVIEILIQHGARTAKPGEFTLRAFLNGRFDLSQAEAVADLIASDSEISHQTAIKQMKGGFSQEIKRLREELIHFASLIELELDFSEEDVEFANRDELQSIILTLIHTIRQLSTSFSVGNVIKKGVPVVLAGRPNAGKSTLLNALVNEERAIVSDIAGTTRDAIEVPISIEGVLYRLIDTAGIREASDTIEVIGVERTFEHIKNAAVLLYIFDAYELSIEQVKDDLEKLKNDKLLIVLVANKCDLCREEELLELENSLKTMFNDNYPVIKISAGKKQHIDTLKQLLGTSLNLRKQLQDNTIITNLRHFEALNECEQALQKVSNSLLNRVQSDFLAQDIRFALNALSAITGDITTDDLLDNIFSKFCIGK